MLSKNTKKKVISFEQFYKDYDVKNENIKTITKDFLTKNCKNARLNLREMSLISIAIQYGYVFGMKEIIETLKKEKMK